MTSNTYLWILAASGLLYFVVFLSSIYVWRLSNLRPVWVGIGCATLLIGLQRISTFAEVWAEVDSTHFYSIIHLLDILIPLFLLVAAQQTLPAIARINLQLDTADKDKKALQESERKYRALIDSTDAGYVILDSDGQVLECNETYVSFTGRQSLDEVVGHNIEEWVHSDQTVAYVRDELSKHQNGILNKYDGISYRHSNGTVIPVEIHSCGLPTSKGQQIFALVRDISAREEVRKKLEASEKQANLLFENSPISTAIYAPDGRFIRANRAHDELWNVPVTSLFTEFNSDLKEDFNILKDPQSLHLMGKHRLEAIFAGECIALQPFIYRASEIAPDSGRDNTILPMFFPLQDGEGKVESIVQMHIDLTERVAAEQKLAEREALYSALIESTNDGFAVLDPDEAVIDANAEYVRMTGHTTLDEIKGKISRQWVNGDTGLAELHRLLESAGKAHGVRCDYRHPDGTLVPAEVSAALVGSGANIQIVVLARDISERLDADGRLRQAQKMDAIGKLTGGVAHEFNNLLAVIIGNTELAIGDGTANALIGRYLQATLGAAERGADLTHRLLAFSRQTPLAPKVVDINIVLDNACALLKRLIGEDIDLILVKTLDGPTCEVDPGELESIIINLANNARDAMPGGGKLTIEANGMHCDSRNKMLSAGELAAGDYVVVSVSDSGSGITPDIINRVTDPFFTTKGVGEGTGLGLSMAYGFAKQSNGHLSIYSELGEGTTVNIYLPAHTESAQQITSEAVAEAPRGNEKILLVEDDPALAILVSHMLEVLGYRVETAGDVEAGIRLYKKHGDFDLLLTDMILPGARNGNQLANELRAVNPQLKVMYMSGYTENAVLHHGRLDEGIILLQKPFRTSDLSVMVRRALEA